MARRVSRLERELQKLERTDPAVGAARRTYDEAVAVILKDLRRRDREKRTIQELQAGHAEMLALVSYRRPGLPLRHALVHLAELEIIQP